MPGAIPADHVHAHALGDTCHLAPDAAKPDHPKRFAEKLHPFVWRPDAAAHLAIHAREVARTGPEQRDAMLGHRRIAITLDDVNLDATLIELPHVHVACGSCAEENNMVELRALLHQRGGHI